MAAGVGARVRSSASLRLCEFLFDEILRLHPFSAKAAVNGCRAVVRLLFMDVVAAIALDQRLTRKAVDERERMIERTAAEFLQAMADVRSTVEETSRTVLHTADATQTLAERAKQETSRTESSWSTGSERIKAMAEGARAMSSSIVEINDRSGQSLGVVQRVSQDAHTAEHSMRDLAAAAQKIGSIIGLISKIAAQTNLLALNATIEAARAGTTGAASPWSPARSRPCRPRPAAPPTKLPSRSRKFRPRRRNARTRSARLPQRCPISPRPPSRSPRPFPSNRP